VDNKSARRWQDIAAELANEFDQERVLKLSAELDEALAEDSKKACPSKARSDCASVTERETLLALRENLPAQCSSNTPSHTSKNSAECA
jgi:hypothetical protein